MKIKISIIYGFTVILLFCNNVAISQKRKEKSFDSTLEANSEKWKVKEHQRITGLAKPEFGDYITLVAEKLDSPVNKKKRKDSIGTEISYTDVGFDMSKYKTFEKRKFYRMVISKDSDTTEVQFYIHTVSSEKRETVLSKILSKDDESKNIILKYQKNIEGFIFTGNGLTNSHFVIEDFVGSTQTTVDNPGQGNAITGGYILTKTNSLFTEPVMQTFGNPESKFFMKYQKGIFINDTNGMHIALLQFGNEQPFYIWLKRDIDINIQNTIAAFFAVIIGAKNL
jgi:hypothetical protein